MTIKFINIDQDVTPGRRPSGARLYHQGSRFGAPEGRRIDRELVARILYLAEALDRRTKLPGKHGGDLKAAGRDILRALLTQFYNRHTGECFPSYEAIAEFTGRARSTVALALKRLRDVGILEIIRRKVVMRFQTGARESFDCAVQDSNSYLFNFSFLDRSRWGDLALPLFKPGPKSDNRTVTGIKDSKSPENGAAGDAARVPTRAISASGEISGSTELDQALLRLGQSVTAADSTD